MLHIHPLRGQFVPQPGALRANPPRVEHWRARAGQGDRLIGPLAALKAAILCAGQRLSWSHKMLDLVDVVNVERAEYNDGHGSSSCQWRSFS